MKLKQHEGCTVLEIKGDKTNPEKAETIIRFPTGEVSITRTSDNNYWVHFHIKKDRTTGRPISRLLKARLDITGKDTNDANIGDFGDPGLYHLAILTGGINANNKS